MSEFDFDEMMDEYEDEYERSTGTQQSLDSLGTLTVANTIFTSIAMLYFEVRMQNPGADPGEALAMVQERVTESINENTLPYFLEMFEYNDVVNSPTSKRRNNFDTNEEAAEDLIKTEHVITERAILTLQKMFSNWEPFTWLCTAASGKLPEEHLARIRDNEDDGLGDILDGLNWK